MSASSLLERMRQRSASVKIQPNLPTRKPQSQLPDEQQREEMMWGTFVQKVQSVYRLQVAAKKEVL